MNIISDKNNPPVDAWVESDDSEFDDYPVQEYDLSSLPNDFNIATLYDYINRGRIIIPGFQRNYVWDIKRASKLIESLLIGLPIPQLFLFESGNNVHIVIDGQQRLLTLYFYKHGRFPRLDKRSQLRQQLVEYGKIAEDLLNNDEFFMPFKLQLSSPLSKQANRYHGLSYGDLGIYQDKFDLRTIRTIIIRPGNVSSETFQTSVYEIFNRLNTGGVNLTPQEIRASMFHSPFYELLYRLNLRPEWRRLLGQPEVDLHFKDVELLLRGFAMLVGGEDFKASSIAKFLNDFSAAAKQYSLTDLNYFERLFDSFLTSAANLKAEDFRSESNRFSPSVYEAIFHGTTFNFYQARQLIDTTIDPQAVKRLKEQVDFRQTTSSGTGKPSNVRRRLGLAREFLTLQTV